MALLGMYHRTIHTAQRPQNKAFLLRKPLPMAPASFGEQLRAARVTQGHTQAELARKFGVSLSAVKFWEQDRTQPLPTIQAQVDVYVIGGTVPNQNKRKTSGAAPPPSPAKAEVGKAFGCSVKCRRA